VELTHIYWPNMLARKRGGVLNVASMAAFVPGPLMAIYYATKAFVLSFSEALWEESRGTGVHVSCLCPGATTSKFRERAGTGATRFGQTAEVMASMPVAQAGYEGFLKNQRTVITGKGNRRTARMVPFLPRGVVLGMVRKMQSPAADK
jgi:short-subunit dehydrogenase